MQPKIVRKNFQDYFTFTPRQFDAVKALTSGQTKFALYGGAMGGGKSAFLRWYCLYRLMLLRKTYGVENTVAMLACEDYPSLKDRQLQKIALEFPPFMGRMHADHSVYGRCFILSERYGSGVITFRNLDDPSKYMSAEFALIAVDELTKNERPVFDALRNRLRWPGVPDIECQFVGATNPGGIGHAWVKQLWIDRDFPEEWTTPVDYRPSFTFIPSLATDNPHLDPGYWAYLSTLPEHLRAAYRDGSWEIFMGQAFPEFSEQRHVMAAHNPPDGAPLYMTFDWGYGAPFSIMWWYVDNDGRMIAFSEWYGWSGTADQGLRLSDSQIAEGIKEREAKLGLDVTAIRRLAGHDCWNKKPDYMGGGQGPSTAEVFTTYGLYLTKADPSRALKLRQFRERLRLRDGERPMLQVTDNCKHFIRTIKSIPMDPKHVEDVDGDSEDHCFDSAAQLAMARPLAMDKPKPKITPTEALWDAWQKPSVQFEHEFFGNTHLLEEQPLGTFIDTISPH